jgi:DNA-binding XRE family transcriptional regulator
MKGDSKYQPLMTYLQRSNDTEVTLTLAEIELLIGEALPASAHSKRAWWSNRSKGALQAKAWMGAGYLVEELDLDTGQVTFRRPPTTYKAEWVGDTVKWQGELVKGLRRHLGMTQSEFADKLGVRQQTVSDWENNAYDPRRAMSKYLTLVAEQAGFRYTTEGAGDKTERQDARDESTTTDAHHYGGFAGHGESNL